ncbi:MAG: hypothetical protein NT074_00355 [Methanomicrobiales archaeon]|jgi:hypothetical protein|nr:hypothetical protein [Methanomicrobiales archaeon]
MEIAENLKKFLESGDDWERRPTSVKGVSIVRLPPTKSRPAALAVDINPIGSKGLPMKKKGVMVMNSEEIIAFREVFGSEKVLALMQALNELAPERRPARGEKDEVIMI